MGQEIVLPEKINFVILKDGNAVGAIEAFNSGIAIIKWILEKENGDIKNIMDPEYMNRFSTLVNNTILFYFEDFSVAFNPIDTIKN